MPTVDEILAGSPLSGLRRVSSGGGDRGVAGVRLAERFAELDDAPPGSFVVLSRLASAEITDYRLDMALRWAAIRRVAAVAAFSAQEWEPGVTALDIAGHAGIALVSVPEDADLAALVQAVFGEIGGGAERALARAGQGLEEVRQAERTGAGPEELGQAAGHALGTKVEYVMAPPEEGVSVPVLAGESPSGYFAAPEAGGEIGIASGLVLHAAAAAAARYLDLARRAIQTPVRSRSELLAELLMSDSAISEDLLDRARQLGIPVSGWHLAVRIEADDLDEAEHDEVRRFELLESAGQAALQAVSASGETWYLSRIARAIILIRVTTSNPGPQAGARAARSAERALQAIMARLSALRFRAGVGAAHEGPMGLRASAAEARGALAAARAARRPGRGRRPRRGGHPADADGVVRVGDRARLGAGPARAAGEAGRGARRHRDPDARRLPGRAGFGGQDRGTAAPAPQRGDQPAPQHHRTARRRPRRPGSAPRPAARLPGPAARLSTGPAALRACAPPRRSRRSPGVPRRRP